jgi:hypothetical protein
MMIIYILHLDLSHTKLEAKSFHSIFYGIPSLAPYNSFIDIYKGLIKTGSIQSLKMRKCGIHSSFLEKVPNFLK